MNKSKIEWCEHTWNPVVGCKHDCWYCYAKKIAKGNYRRQSGLYKKGTTKKTPCKKCRDYAPHFHPERLNQPSRLKKPRKIFVCSMADLFGDWVPNSWIRKIIKVAAGNPRHIFQFLTKNPKRYLEFEFPENCWLGATIDYANQTRLDYLRKKKNNYKFVSFEPLLGNMSALKGLTEIDLAIVGAMTKNGKKNVIPKKEWIDSIKHPNIFYKNNIKKFLPKKD